MQFLIKIFLFTAFFTTPSLQRKTPSSPPLFSDADRAALVEFKASISNDTTGILSTWSGRDCCSGRWQGVECIAGRVTKLIMQRPSSSQALFMKGTLPHSLTNLQYLEVLVISGMKHISGTIPHSFASLTHLTHLALEDNSLHGTIPSSLGLLGNLHTMSLNGNRLTGKIPPALGNLRNLLQLSLANNALTGPLPITFNSLRNMHFLDLSFNSLSGSIPNFLGRLSNLTYLVLTSNKFVNQIPISLFNLTNLSELSINQNLLTGRIPTQIGNLKSVSVLRLSSNKLTGQIPDSIAQLHNLWNLNLSRNMLTDPLPNKAFGEGLPSLLSIDLSYNDLNLQTVPDWIRTRQLYDVHLAGCKIKGALPNFTNPEFLTTLDLSDNYFTKGTSSFMANMTNLEAVKISNNLLTSDISSIKLPDQITILDLHSNQLHGSLSKLLSNNQLHSLKVVNVGSNEISGHIPNSVSSLAKLESLDISRNQIAGRIPRSLGLLEKLRWLDVSMNKLTGRIPESLLGMEDLKHGSFRVNRLCGKIPQGRPYNIFPAAAYAHNLCLCAKPLPPCRHTAAFLV
ncbi:LRR receptor-like serine/threonine-protein kinase FLS2 [Salvia divinorum]|uniref:LRR receptor-like serine/threonine-protein kinase FLS2 n=1 Tax=Salvia divinorum TaxID=28513 RepID=A0ABD1HET1_SALDI